jgi:hypothetical protein
LPGVAEAADTARRAVDRLLASRVLRNRSVEVTAEVALRDARASAALDGPVPELEELRAALAEGRDVGTAVEGALRVAAALGELAPVWGRAPRQALARLHVLAAGDGGDPDRLGRPAGGAEVGQRLTVLVDALVAPTTAPAAVVAAVVHGELLALAPFGEASGVVARAAARLVLLERGLDPKAVTAPDVGHLLAGRAGYAAAATAYADGDVATWVLHCCRALAAGADEGLVACDAVKGQVVQK